MKPLALLPIVAILFCASCRHDNPQTTQPKQHEVPKPLQNDSKDFSLLNKRVGPSNLVEAIYADLVKKEPELQKLEDQREHFGAGHADSLKAFDEYDAKSSNYYVSANETLDQIKDTVLKQRLRLILADSKKKYGTQTEKYRSLIAGIDSDQTLINNYYLTLKIAATLPVMEDYQTNNMPDSKPIKAIAIESEKLKQQTRKLEAKYLSKEK